MDSRPGVLLRQTGVGTGQDALGSPARSGAQLDADRKAALRLGDQIARLAQVKGTAGDEQDVIGLDRAVLGVDRGALDQRQQVALPPWRDTSAPWCLAGGDLVDLVEEDDAVLLDVLQRLCLISSSLTSFAASSSSSSFIASSTRICASCVSPAACWRTCALDLLVISIHAPGGAIAHLQARPRRLRSRFPCRRTVPRAASCGILPRCVIGRLQVVETDRVRGGSASAPAPRRRPRGHAFFIAVRGSGLIRGTSARSRMMVSTSRPT